MNKPEMISKDIQILCKKGTLHQNTLLRLYQEFSTATRNASAGARVIAQPALWAENRVVATIKDIPSTMKLEILLNAAAKHHHCRAVLAPKQPADFAGETYVVVAPK